MATIKNIIGQKFGRLTVLKHQGSDKSGRAIWECKCDCGNRKTVSSKNLRNGSTKSCGCYQREQASSANRTHGRGKSPEYGVWSSMIQRCTNPKNKEYHNYGGRGIQVCNRWLKFDNFISDMGERPSGKHSLDREDNDKGYAPGNCRWATSREQSFNKRTNVWAELPVGVLAVPQIAEKFNIPLSVLYARIARGYTGYDLINLASLNGVSVVDTATGFFFASVAEAVRSLNVPFGIGYVRKMLRGDVPNKTSLQWA